jgi:hypothetical protein
MGLGKKNKQLDPWIVSFDKSHSKLMPVFSFFVMSMSRVLWVFRTKRAVAVSKRRGDDGRSDGCTRAATAR